MSQGRNSEESWWKRLPGLFGYMDRVNDPSREKLQFLPESNPELVRKILPMLFLLKFLIPCGR